MPSIALSPLARGVAPTRRPAARAAVAEASADAGGQAIRIKLKSFDKTLITESAAAIVDAAKATGASVSGPVPLPTKCVNLRIGGACACCVCVVCVCCAGRRAGPLPLSSGGFSSLFFSPACFFFFHARPRHTSRPPHACTRFSVDLPWPGLANEARIGWDWGRPVGRTAPKSGARG